MKIHNLAKILFVTLLIISTISCRTQKEQLKFTDLAHPKREFRGAWIHTVHQSQYKNMNSEQMKEYFTTLLNQLQAAGINAVVFQIRPQADAFYKSKHEPWSRFLTGTQGQAPDNNFDPLAFLIEECHARNMELHAWMNPYRVGEANQTFANNHIYNKYPERFVQYGKLIYFDPGISQNREFICEVVEDIVQNYDVDAIHMDDYFYPYPIPGEEFPDSKSFADNARGFKPDQKDDWRRDNVDKLIEEIKFTIVRNKPWVRFGVSPFGIYRNKKSTPDNSGSETNGLQNYDDLYADVKLWVQKGWVDYNIPQLYWEIGHKAADYSTLVNWWADNNFQQPLYIGQDIRRTMDVQMPSGDNQLNEKMRLARSFENIHGNCFWYGYVIPENYKGIADELNGNYHKYPALIPAYTHMHSKKPKDVKKISEAYTPAQHILKWDANSEKRNPESAQYFVVYRFDENQKVDTDNSENIFAITRDKQIVLPYENGKKKYKFVVTAVDAFHNESKGKAKKITL